MKKTLRKDFLLRREALPKSEFWRMNGNIVEQLAKIDWGRLSFVHIFLPIRERKEVDTFEIISFFKERYPEINLVIPRTDFIQKTMENVLFDHEYTILQKNRFHIPEPVFGEVIPVEKIDAVFVPLLAFDLKGNRIGYGGGFYDRFLLTCKKDVFKVGLSLFEPLPDLIEKEPFDISLDACITPDKIFYFKSEG